LARQVKQCGDKLLRLSTHKTQRQAANKARKEKLGGELKSFVEEYERVQRENMESNAAIEVLLEEVIGLLVMFRLV
jgi:hypothetical protein